MAPRNSSGRESGGPGSVGAGAATSSEAEPAASSADNPVVDGQPAVLHPLQNYFETTISSNHNKRFEVTLERPILTARGS